MSAFESAHGALASLRRKEPLAPLTTFRVGGPADWFVEPRGRDELLTTIAIAHGGPACR